MIEALDGMPPATIGFRATGRLTAEDYRERFIPVLRESIERGEVRMVFAVGPGYEGFDLGALREDVKTGLELELRHRDVWRRVAVVTDVDWIAKAMHMFAWMIPGEVRVFDVGELEQAKRWVAE
jgi:hypothetical protein